MDPLSPPLPAARLEDMSEHYLRNLGGLVVTTGRLELVCRDIASAMKVDLDVVTSTAVALDLAREQSERSLPPWSTVSADGLRDWMRRAAALLDERDRVFAAVPATRFSGTAGDAATVTAADGSHYSADDSYLERLMVRSQRCEVSGHDLRHRLEYADSDGMLWPLAAWHTAYQHAEPENMSWFPDRLAAVPANYRRWLATG